MILYTRIHRCRREGAKTSADTVSNKNVHTPSNGVSHQLARPKHLIEPDRTKTCKRYCPIATRTEHYLLRIVANHRQRPNPLPVEAEVLGEGLRQSDAVPISHEPPDRPSIMLRVPRSEALRHKQWRESHQYFKHPAERSRTASRWTT